MLVYFSTALTGWQNKDDFVNNKQSIETKTNLIISVSQSISSSLIHWLGNPGHFYLILISENQIISAGLEPALSHIEKSCIAPY